MKKSILYLISLLAMMFIAIPKISNAAAPEEDCQAVVFTCPDGTQGMGVVCNENDLSILKSIFCKVEVKPGDTIPAN